MSSSRQKFKELTILETKNIKNTGYYLWQFEIGRTILSNMQNAKAIKAHIKRISDMQIGLSHW